MYCGQYMVNIFVKYNVGIVYCMATLFLSQSILEYISEKFSAMSY